jgi:hypothetical protein
VALLCYVAFGNTILNEYGSKRYLKLQLVSSIKTTLPLLFLPKYRNAIRFWLFSLLFLYVLLFCKMESVNISSGMNLVVTILLQSII